MLKAEGSNTQKEINVEVIKSIESITVDKTETSIKQGKEDSITVTLNPQEATEDLKFESSDENVATVYKDSSRNGANVYKVFGNSGGSAQIRFYSDNNPQIIKTVNVTVIKQDMPEVTSVTIENAEEGKVFKTGEEMILRLNFDSAVKGDVPELSMKFGDYYSVNKAEFIDKIENDTVLRYKYVVADGDNGELTVQKLLGGQLTDIENSVKATTTLANNVYNSTEGDIEEIEYVNDGLYETVEGAVADTENPEIRIVSYIDKSSNWLKNGDEIKVQIASEEELKEKPTVLFNGIEANVEGEGAIYTASLPVDEKIEDGYVEIKVDNIVDLAGNTKEAIVAKEYNIDEAIIVDNSAPIVSSLNIKKELGKELNAGESFDIIVNFADTANVTKEFITSESIPGLNLKFGGKDAKGTLTSDYEPGKYVQAIKYTYTVAKEDKGEVTVEGMTGTVTDAAGNVSDLSTMNIKSNMAEAQTDNNPTTPVDISKTTNTTNITRTPTTGDKIAMSAAILLTVILTAVIVELVFRRNKRDI